MSDMRTIHLDPPQPCGFLDPASGALCGRPATSALIAPPPPEFAGCLLVLPRCPACTQRQQQLYTGPPSAASASAITTARDCGDLVVVCHTISLPDPATPATLRAAADLLSQSADRMAGDASILRQRANEVAASN